MRNEWISADQALERVAATSSDDELAKREIVRLCRTGHLTARFERMLTRSISPNAGGGLMDSDGIVPLWFWGSADNVEESNFDWSNSYFTADRVLDGEAVHVKIWGVQFLDLGLNLAATNVSAASQSTSKSKNKGGAPGLEFWDQMWAYLCVEALQGRFHPKRQAEIQGAMTQWILDNNYDAGDTTIKRRARMLWEQMQKLKSLE